MTSLEEYATKRGRKAKPNVEWAPPTLDDFEHGNVLAFDQSLSATGLVALVCDSDGLRVLGSRTLRTQRPHADESKEGSAEWMLRAKSLRELVISALAPYQDLRGWRVVNELPPVLSLVNRPESSLIACTVLHLVCADLNIPMAPMIGAQNHKRLTGGNAKAQKKEHHAVLKTYCPTLVGNWAAVTNADERDAASVGLAELLRK